MKLRSQLAGGAVALLALAAACSRGGSTSSVKDIAPATQVSDAQIASATNNTDANAAIVYPKLKYMAEGDLNGKGHDFVLTQTLHVDTNDQQVQLNVSNFHTVGGGQGASQVNDSLKPQNGVTTYHRADSAALAQLDASNPNFKNGEGALIFIASLTKTSGKVVKFNPPVPFMAIPSTAGAYAGIGAGLTFETVVNWGLRDHPATVQVHNLSADPAAPIIQVEFQVLDDKDGSIAGFIPFPRDARYVIDAGNERLQKLWTCDGFKGGSTILIYQLCESIVPDASRSFNNDAGCNTFVHGSVRIPPGGGGHCGAIPLSGAAPGGGGAGLASPAHAHPGHHHP